MNNERIGVLVDRIERALQGYHLFSEIDEVLLEVKDELKYIKDYTPNAVELMGGFERAALANYILLISECPPVFTVGRNHEILAEYKCSILKDRGGYRRDIYMTKDKVNDILRSQSVTGTWIIPSFVDKWDITEVDDNVYIVAGYIDDCFTEAEKRAVRRR